MVYLLKDSHSALLIAGMVFLTTFSQLGFIQLLNLAFKDHGFEIEVNAISVVNLITCVGLSV